MDNSENKNVDVTPETTAQTQEVDQAQQPAPEATDANSNSTPLQTLDAINSGATVVTADLIEARIREAASKRGDAAPLANRLRQANDRAEDRRRERGERPERPSRERGGRDGSSEVEGESSDRGRRRERQSIVVPRMAPHTSVQAPNRREALTGELAQEFENISLDGAALDALISETSAIANAEQLEDGAKVNCRVVSIHLDSVFIDVGAREQGVIPLKQFPDDFQLEIGGTFEGIVTRFNSAEGVYEVSLPLAAAESGDWLSLTKGAIVEAVVTGSNTGGLECQVGKLKGFMPFSQIAIFRVENAEEYVGERWKCIVTEINPERRRLIVSRRAYMQKERDELREKTMAELEVGQTREGLVRKIIEAGVFVDLGGVDGFIPVSQLSWGRVRHPSEIVKEGDRVKVRVANIDKTKNRISLSLRDEAVDPWATVETVAPVGAVVRGRVTSIMAFGAFVEIAPGLEGLVHISEISYKRVQAVTDALKEGDFVDAKVLSVDLAKRKISLSIKQTQPDPRQVKKAEEDAKLVQSAEEQRAKDEEEIQRSKERIRELNKKQGKKPLGGGLGGAFDDGGTGLHF